MSTRVNKRLAAPSDLSPVVDSALFLRYDERSLFIFARVLRLALSYMIHIARKICKKVKCTVKR